MSEHLVLPGQHLGLGLIERALVPSAQREWFPAILADGRRSKPWRGTAAGGSGPVPQVVAGKIEGAAREDG